MLTKINDILSTPSKYNTIAKYLKPCLHTNRLEDAVHICLDQDKCKMCGFCQWWSKGLRPKLFKEDSTMDTSNTLFGDEWTTADIYWRYFSSIVKPTIASHAEDVADDDDV